MNSSDSSLIPYLIILSVSWTTFARAWSSGFKSFSRCSIVFLMCSDYFFGKSRVLEIDLICLLTALLASFLANYSFYNFWLSLVAFPIKESLFFVLLFSIWIFFFKSSSSIFNFFFSFFFWISFCISISSAVKATFSSLIWLRN